jgi:hypothetical protein
MDAACQAKDYWHLFGRHRDDQGRTDGNPCYCSDRRPILQESLIHPVASLRLARLIGFWLWAFSRRALSGSKRVAISMLIVIGMVMIAPFMFLGGVLLALSGLGTAAGVLALAEMWLPGEGPRQ